MALIYIVEDDESIREIEEFSLKNAWHTVYCFGDAKGLYHQMDAVLPDLLVADIMLPDENGNEIVKKLRKDPKTRMLPIIMVTAKTTDIDLVRGMEDGADDYIKKPFSVMELISRVKALLRRSMKEEVQELMLDELMLNNQKREVRLSGRTIELTYKEYELLSYLMLNR